MDRKLCWDVLDSSDPVIKDRLVELTNYIGIAAASVHIYIAKHVHFTLVIYIYIDNKTSYMVNHPYFQSRGMGYAERMCACSAISSQELVTIVYNQLLHQTRPLFGFNI